MLIYLIVFPGRLNSNTTDVLVAFVKDNSVAFGGCVGAFLIIGVIIIIAYRRIKAIRDEKPNIKRRIHNVGEDEFEYTVDNEERAKFGYLNSNIFYDYDKGFLKVEKIQCISLYSPDDIPLDTYVKVRIEPKSWNIKEQRSKVIRDSNDPLFNNTFSFKVNFNDLKLANIVWEIMDKDLSIGKDSFVGLARQPLVNIDLDALKKTGLPVKLKIKDTDDELETFGEICIVLRNMPMENKCTVTIIEAKGLNLKLIHRKFPPVYVTVTLYHNNSKLFTRTTETRYNTNCPYFSESYTFPLKVGRTANSYLVLKVMKITSIGFDKCIGQTLVGHRSDSWSGRKQWSEMIASPKRAIALWHSLAK